MSGSNKKIDYDYPANISFEECQWFSNSFHCNVSPKRGEEQRWATTSVSDWGFTSPGTYANHHYYSEPVYEVRIGQRHLKFLIQCTKQQALIEQSISRYPGLAESYRDFMSQMYLTIDHDEIFKK